jgi:hypothetical protein
LTRDPEADAISFATATFDMSGAKGRTGDDQMEAATRPEQKVLPTISVHEADVFGGTAVFGSGRSPKARTATVSLRATKRKYSNLVSLMMFQGI